MSTFLEAMWHMRFWQKSLIQIFDEMSLGFVLDNLIGDELAALVRFVI